MEYIGVSLTLLLKLGLLSFTLQLQLVRPLLSTQTQLQLLRPGDRLKYHGVKWDVKDYSTYDDAYGYQTAEWLLSAPKGTEYYLLREVDSQNPETLVNWYLADEVRPQIFLPDSRENIVPTLWQDMQGQKEPYPELQLFCLVYYFESKTQGSFEGDEVKTSRITWDYWDKDHHRNLALEAWPTNQELHVYSTKVVEPEEFSDIEKGVVQPESSQASSSAICSQRILAFSILVAGILMMIFG